LFVLFTDDLNSIDLSSKLILYADDMLLYRCVNNEYDVSVLEKDSNALAQWVTENKLNLNARKTKFMLFTNRHNFLPHISVTVADTTIERVNHLKYLGVTLSSDLSWSTHIDIVTRRARRLLGFLYRSFLILVLILFIPFLNL
jgi:hypothetical protein